MEIITLGRLTFEPKPTVAVVDQPQLSITTESPIAAAPVPEPVIEPAAAEPVRAVVAGGLHGARVVNNSGAIPTTGTVYGQQVNPATVSPTTSKTNRSDSRLSIRRFRALSPEDQQAVIEFLKQL